MSIPTNMFDASNYPAGAFGYDNIRLMTTGKTRPCPYGGQSPWPVMRYEYIEGAYCQHCENTGWVVVDATDGAAPCLNCKAGKAVEVAHRIWFRVPVESVTWNGGLSYAHTAACRATCETGPDRGRRCNRPALGSVGLCDWHRQANPDRAAVYRDQGRVAVVADGAL